MTFFLRKIIAAVIMPLPLLLLMGGVGWLLWFRGRRARLGQTLVAGSLLGIFLFSFQPVSNRLISMVEYGYPAFPGDSVEVVVVLGGGHDSDPALPASAQLSAQALYRLTEGMRIAATQPWTRLVVSGYGGLDPKPNAQVYAEVATALGVDPERITMEPRPNSTAQEAEFLEPALAGRRFALVTSASHMPRAMALFRARGLDPVAAPTGHLGRRSGDLTRLFPRGVNLTRVEVAWHEVLGRIWAWLRGDTRG